MKTLKYPKKSQESKNSGAEICANGGQVCDKCDGGAAECGAPYGGPGQCELRADTELRQCALRRPRAHEPAHPRLRETRHVIHRPQTVGASARTSNSMPTTSCCCLRRQWQERHFALMKESLLYHERVSWPLVLMCVAWHQRHTGCKGQCICPDDNLQGVRLDTNWGQYGGQGGEQDNNDNSAD